MICYPAVENTPTMILAKLEKLSFCLLIYKVGTNVFIPFSFVPEWIYDNFRDVENTGQQKLKEVGG